MIQRFDFTYKTLVTIILRITDYTMFSKGMKYIMEFTQFV